MNIDYTSIIVSGEKWIVNFINDIQKRYQNITRQDVWDILMYELLPKIQDFLESQYDQINDNYNFLQTQLAFYNEIKLEPQQYKKSIYYKIWSKISIFQKEVVMRLSYDNVFQLLESFLNEFYNFCIQLKVDMNKYVIEKGNFEKYNSKVFDEFQSLIQQMAGHVEHDGINLKNVKIVSEKIETYKLYEIQQFYYFCKRWYNSYKGLLKTFISPPDKIFRNDIVMQLIVLYVKKDVKYNIFNVICSDEFIQILRDMIKILNRK